MRDEEWRDVPGWEGARRVSDGGRVMSYAGNVLRMDDRGRVALRDGLKPVRVEVVELLEAAFYTV